MDSHRSASLILFALFPFLFISSSSAYRNFYVGDKAGWVLDPSESYDQWSARNRFQVNDTLVFKYKEGKDSVLQVTKEDYDSCNRRIPLKRMTSGSSAFQLPQSGPFYFISGKKGSCEKGQKLIVVVLAIRPKPVTQPPKSPSPAAQPPTTTSPVSPISSPPPLSQPPSTSPVSQPPAPIAKPPASAPQPSASPVSPPQSAATPSQSPNSPSPVPSLSPKSPSPVSPPQSALTPSQSPNSPSPVPSLSPKSPSPVSPPQSAPVPAHSPSPAPTSKSPTLPPSAQSPKSSSSPAPPPSTTPGSDSQPAPSPDGGVSDIDAPAPSTSASWAVSPSSLLILVVSVVVSSVIGISA